MSKRCCAVSCYNSVATNRSVAYFGFPKSLEYASAWAKAAGREDLLEKNINNIIKYFLCSEHFSADSFLDPPQNQKLKKTSRPVVVPIPTIFNDNFNKCVSISLKEDRCAVIDESQEPSNTASYNPQNIPDIEHDLNLGEPLMLSSNGNFITAGQGLSIELRTRSAPTNQQTLNDTAVEDISYSDNAPSYVNCRLCLAASDNELLIPIFADGSEVACMLDKILPDMIKRNDGFPQEVCLVCLENATRCLNTIEKFKEIQDNMRIMS